MIRIGRFDVGIRRNTSPGLRSALARLITLALVAGAIGSSSASSAQTAGWTATWGAAQASPLTNDPQNAGLADQTVRMIVRTSEAGDEVRARISNAYGAKPLIIGEARVALSAGAGAIVKASDRKLTFGGQPSVVIAPGATIVSDAAAFHVPAISHLAVSLYLPLPNDPATYHHVCLCDTYVVPHSAADRENFPAESARAHWYYLADVEVRAAGRPDLIVAFGDSITDGFRSTTDRTWPNLLADRLAERGAPLAVVNEGIAGNALLHDFRRPDGLHGGPNGLSRFDRDALNMAGVKFVIVLIGINDIGHSQNADSPATAQDIVDGYRQLVARAHARGLKIYGGTLTPIGGSFYDDPAHRAMREAVNQAIRTGHIFDGVIDFDEALRDPQQPQQLLAEYDSGDHLHPNAAGDLRMAQIIELPTFVDPGQRAGIDPNGRPLYEPADHTRYEVWHDDGGWHLTAQAATNHIARFTGSVSIRNGAFTDVANPVRPNIPWLPHELFSLAPDGAAMTFDFTTTSAPMVVSFRAEGGNPVLDFSLRTGEALPPEQARCGPGFACAPSPVREAMPVDVYIGQAGAHPETVPFELTAHADLVGEPRVARAQAAWDALVNTLAVPGRPGLFYESPGNQTVVAVWGHSQILHAALDMAMITHNSRDFDQALAALNDYTLNDAYAPTVHPGSSEVRLWDDNGWVLLALEQAMYQLPDPKRFEQMVATTWSNFIVKGQAAGGGIYWKENDPDPVRGIPATGSNIEVSLRLHLAGPPPPNAPLPLAFAEDNYAWVNANLHAPEGYYWNGWFDYGASYGVAGSCHPSRQPPPPMNVCEQIHSYNQGVMIGADVLLYRINGDASRLDNAAATAAATLDYFYPDRLWKEPPAFNAILFRNLMALDHYRHNVRYRTILEGYLERIWTEARNPRTGLFTEGGLGHFGHAFGSLDQAAIVQMFALLAWPQDRTQDLS